MIVKRGGMFGVIPTRHGNLGNLKIMMFVDGENLAMRYGEKLGDNIPYPHVKFERDVFVWSDVLNLTKHRNCDVIRRYYYTSVRGAIDKLHYIHERLESLGIEAPKVFPRTKS